MADTGGTSAPKGRQDFTLRDWRSWPVDERWELIDGQVWDMSAAPTVPHQEAAGNLFRLLGNFLDGKTCKALIAPLDVFLEEDEDDDSQGMVVEPDVLVVCDPGKFRKDGVHGAPDLVAEVLSESTTYKDLGIKKMLYARSGVREYWIIHPDTGSVLVHLLDGANFAPATEYLKGSPVPSQVLPGFSWVFPAGL